MNFEALVKHISTIQNTLQAQAAHAVNLALTSRNWLVDVLLIASKRYFQIRRSPTAELVR